MFRPFHALSCAAAISHPFQPRQLSLPVLQFFISKQGSNKVNQGGRQLVPRAALNVELLVRSAFDWPLVIAGFAWHVVFSWQCQQSWIGWMTWWITLFTSTALPVPGGSYLGFSFEEERVFSRSCTASATYSWWVSAPSQTLTHSCSRGTVLIWLVCLSRAKDHSSWVANAAPDCGTSMPQEEAWTNEGWHCARRGRRSSKHVPFLSPQHVSHSERNRNDFSQHLVISLSFHGDNTAW